MFLEVQNCSVHFCSVSLVQWLGCELEDQRIGVGSCQVEEIFLLHSIQTASAVHSTSSPISTSGPSHPGLKSLGHEGNDSAPTSSKVKDAWNYTFTSPYIFMVQCLIRHREKFLCHVYCVFTVAPNCTVSIVELTLVIFIVTQFETLCEETRYYYVQTSSGHNISTETSPTVFKFPRAKVKMGHYCVNICNFINYIRKTKSFEF
jgi:hypothetical protein